MIQKPTGAWGFITGKLSLSPEQALEMFGFEMSPDAQGVLFRVYTLLDDNNVPHKEQIISNYKPPSNPQTIPQQLRRMKFAGGVNHWKALTPSEKEEWNDRADKSHRILSGFNLWMSMYMRGLT